MVGIVKWLRHRVVAPVYVGSNPTIHPTKKKDFQKKSFFFILGCSQVVRHHTLTVAFRWFESIQPNQTKRHPKGCFFVWLGS